MRTCAKHAHYRPVSVFTVILPWGGAPFLSFSRSLSRVAAGPAAGSRTPSPPQGSGLVSPPAGRGLTATTALPQRLVPWACALGGGRLLLGSPTLPSSLRVRSSRGGGGGGRGGQGVWRGAGGGARTGARQEQLVACLWFTWLCPGPGSTLPAPVAPEG